LIFICSLLIAWSQRSSGPVSGPDRARPLAERALAIDEAAYGPDHPAVGIRLSNLSGILQILRQPDQALLLAQRALTIHEAAYGPSHLAVAIDLINLVTILQDLSQPDRARPLAERALTIHEAIYGPYHPTVLRLRYHLDSLG
jgi:tetratricopeptide (TPR) repeat protein